MLSLTDYINTIWYIATYVSQDLKDTLQVLMAYAAQLRQPIENSLVLCLLKTLRLYTWAFQV